MGGMREREGAVLARGIILSPPTSLCLPGVFRTQMTTLVFLHIPCSSLHSHFKPVIFLYPDELVFTVRQPGCRIHVAVSYFASALVHGMMGDRHHSWSPERAVCVCQICIVLGSSVLSRSIVLVLLISVKTKDCAGDRSWSSEIWRCVVWLRGDRPLSSYFLCWKHFSLRWGGAGRSLVEHH